MKYSIEIQGLSKIYKRHRNYKNFFLGKSTKTVALNGVSINVKEGEIFGILGPNGAGKTTLIKILTTLILPTTGTASVCGYDIAKKAKEVRNIVGLIHSDERSFFWRLSGRQNLEFFAAVLQIPRKMARLRIDEVIGYVELNRYADNLFQDYSTGMKQRLAIARGLLNKPKVLFMDEAMRSIDPISTRKVRDLIKEMIRERKDMTVVMATNRLDEASDLCDRIAIIDKGDLLRCKNIEEMDLKVKDQMEYEIVVKGLRTEIIDEMRKKKWIVDWKKTFQLDGKVGITMTIDREEENIHSVLKAIIENNGVILRCDRKERSIEEIFTSIIEENNLYPKAVRS